MHFNGLVPLLHCDDAEHEMKLRNGYHGPPEHTQHRIVNFLRSESFTRPLDDDYRSHVEPHRPQRLRLRANVICGD